ncbi:MAG TPA: glycoside hydrolase family 3 C-terminal domain-containing protein [Solirubrobacteraceae bacterium]
MRTRGAIAALCCAAAVLGGSAPARANAQCPWMDAHKSDEQRAGELLRAMSIVDKVHMLHGSEYVMWAYGGSAGHVAGNPSLCIPDLVLNDAGGGVANGKLDTTVFPGGISQAAAWDPALQREFGHALGQEAWDKGVDVQLAPGVNIGRVPMNGRNFEYMGEDPYLAGLTAASVISGIQSSHVIATVKHYAFNNQETKRDSSSSDVDERTMQEIELPGFEAAVKDGRAGSVMCSYNRVNGVYACENKTLLDDILKQEFGFDGWVMSDWDATHSTVEAANAGLDQEMAVYDNGQYFGDPLKAAVESGKVGRARLDDMVMRILRTMFRVGVFDHPPAPQPQSNANLASTPAHRALAQRMAEDSTVLLKNDGALLPLDQPGKTIAVIGSAAGPVGAHGARGGGGSSGVVGQPRTVSPLEGIQQQAAAKGDQVIYADGSSRADAVAAASAADVAVVFAGDSESEGADRADLSLHNGFCLFACAPAGVDQDAIITDVAGANPRTVVVLETGGPVVMPWVKQVPALLEAWYPGMEGGNAIAAILFGEANPSGRLPQTFPASEKDLPTAGSPQQYPGVDDKDGVPRVTYSEGLEVGYRWYDAKGIAPLFPFGYGLSYTSFRYSDLSVQRAEDGAEVGFTLENTGARTGAEVAQVYVGQPPAAGEPPRQLKGYRKVTLAPGESARVRVPLGARAFAHWDTGSHGWVVAPGTYGVFAGGSSRDLPLQGDVRLPAQQDVPYCARRTVRVAVRGPRGEWLHGAEVVAGGHRVRLVRRGRRLYAIVTLRGAAKRVRITGRTRAGRRITRVRTLSPCAGRTG